MLKKPTKKPKESVAYVRLEADLHRRVSLMAAKLHMSAAAFLRMAARDTLERLK